MPFTECEIAFMRKIGLNMDFEHSETFTTDEWIHISDVVEDRYVLCELDENYFPTSDGVICEDILEKLARKEPTKN